jgi:hypothetical protein
VIAPRWLALVGVAMVLAACSSPVPRGTAAGKMFMSGGQITFTSPTGAPGTDGLVRATAVSDGKTYDTNASATGAFNLRLTPGRYWLTGKPSSWTSFDCFVNNGQQPITISASRTLSVDVLCPIG